MNTDLPQPNSVHWIGSPREPAGRHFRITVTDRSEASIKGEVHEVTAWEGDMEPAEFELYLTFYMKWDACCHITFGDRSEPAAGQPTQDGYLHLCGPDSWESHIWLMAELYRWAERAIPINKETSLCGSFEPRV